MTIDEIGAVLATLSQKIDRLIAQTAPRKPGDDQRVYKDPKEKYWQGESYEGGQLSECPADYLRALAKYKNACAWANRKEGDPEKAKYADKDEATARLALAWAEYREATTVEEPRKTPFRKVTTPTGNGDDFGPPPDDDIPFVTSAQWHVLPMTRWSKVF